MPWALRRSAVTGSSFGARGTLSSFKPASCGRWLPLREFTCLLDHTRFSQVSAPPRVAHLGATAFARLFVVDEGKWNQKAGSGFEVRCKNIAALDSRAAFYL